jgi:hypothetical protein
MPLGDLPRKSDGSASRVFLFSKSERRLRTAEDDRFSEDMAVTVGISRDVQYGIGNGLVARCLNTSHLAERHRQQSGAGDEVRTTDSSTSSVLKRVVSAEVARIRLP